MWGSLESKWQLIADNTICQIYSSGVNKGYSYPYRMVKSYALRPAVRERSLEMMVDSNIDDPDASNEEIIEEAIKYNADYIMPKDKFGKPDETVEMMKQFFDVFPEDVEGRPKPFVIIQPPLAETFRRYESFYSRFGRYALGGMKDMKPAEQTRELYEFWKTLKASDKVEQTSVTTHGFGLGLSPQLVVLLRTYPHILDSLDVSTPELAIKNNEIPDGLWDRIPVDLPRGDSRRDLQARYTEATLYMMNYLLGTEVNQDDLYERMELFDVADFNATSDDNETPAAADD